ncbi:hypothetical protein GW17_00029372 [Ensete ventricosum]|nr:hypothetical protein GW17_00029372 [Ensete ventricosum]
MMFNGFGASGYTRVRSCTERCLRRFPESGSAGSTIVGTTSRVANAISDLACSGCQGGCPRGPRADTSRLIGRNDVAVHVVLGLPR